MRADLSMAVSDLLDAQVLGGRWHHRRTVRRLPGDRRERGPDRPERLAGPRDLRPGRCRGGEGIDGKFSGGLSECSVVIGDDTARDLASKFQTNDSDSALAYWAARP